MKHLNAILAGVFFIAAGTIMAIYGYGPVRALVVQAFIWGGLSQFFVQDWRSSFQHIASACAYVAITQVILASFTFAWQIVPPNLP